MDMQLRMAPRAGRADPFEAEGSGAYIGTIRQHRSSSAGKGNQKIEIGEARLPLLRKRRPSRQLHQSDEIADVANVSASADSELESYLS